MYRVLAATFLGQRSRRIPDRVRDGLAGRGNTVAARLFRHVRAARQWCRRRRGGPAQSYNAQTGTISADGAVVLSFQGYVIHADSVEYDQKTGGLHAVGNVVMKDPSGTLFEMESIEITGGMKEAFLNSLTLTTPEGAVITAKDVHYADS